ncbi:hypothetical protein [Sporosarcina sp. A2]|uniref:hypothetical protein n=1 Tax=Sporosarcina sp. A2 TaxID=3393449 RepID=UPI003D7AA148
MQDRTTCDECQDDFTIKLKTKTHKLTIKETFFTCPNCKKKYVAFITDPDCRKLQKEIKQLQLNKIIAAKQFAEDKINEIEYKKMIDETQNEINHFKKILEPKMKKLKWTYAT